MRATKIGVLIFLCNMHIQVTAEISSSYELSLKKKKAATIMCFI